MAETQVNLLDAFKTVYQEMDKNRPVLNDADEYNHDHGDHMADIFKTITQAMQEKQDAAPATQLAYASELLKREQQSGSAKVYAEGLSRAAASIEGQQVVDRTNVMTLLTSLFGSGQQAAEPQDPMMGLLGSLMGGAGGTNQAQSGGLDAGDLISAGLAFMQAKQQGKSVLEALVNALVASSGLSGSSHREQSGKIVADTFLKQVLPMLLK